MGQISQKEDKVNNKLFDMLLEEDGKSEPKPSHSKPSIGNLLEFEREMDVPNVVTKLRYSPYLDRIITFTKGGKMAFWDYDKGVIDFELDVEDVREILVQDKTHIVVLTWKGNGEMEVWDVEKREMKWKRKFEVWEKGNNFLAKVNERFCAGSTAFDTNGLSSVFFHVTGEGYRKREIKYRFRIRCALTMKLYRGITILGGGEVGGNNLLNATANKLQVINHFEENYHKGTLEGHYGMVNKIDSFVCEELMKEFIVSADEHGRICVHTLGHGLIKQFLVPSNTKIDYMCVVEENFLFVQYEVGKILGYNEKMKAKYQTISPKRIQRQMVFIEDEKLVVMSEEKMKGSDDEKMNYLKVYKLGSDIKNETKKLGSMVRFDSLKKTSIVVPKPYIKEFSIKKIKEFGIPGIVEKNRELNVVVVLKSSNKIVVCHKEKCKGNNFRNLKIQVVDFDGNLIDTLSDCDKSYRGGKSPSFGDGYDEDHFIIGFSELSRTGLDLWSIKDKNIVKTIDIKGWCHNVIRLNETKFVTGTEKAGIVIFTMDEILVQDKKKTHHRFLCFCVLKLENQYYDSFVCAGGKKFEGEYDEFPVASFYCRKDEKDSIKFNRFLEGHRHRITFVESFVREKDEKEIIISGGKTQKLLLQTKDGEIVSSVVVGIEMLRGLLFHRRFTIVCGDGMIWLSDLTKGANCASESCSALNLFKCEGKNRFIASTLTNIVFYSFEKD